MRAQRRTRSPTLPALVVLALALSGCSSSGPQAGGEYAAKAHRGAIRYQIQPYQINGVWYYPKADYDYDETGTASWYGEQFHGRATSDGEIFDMNQVSAAHKTLPLPSVVEVTNLQNGRALRIRVNDRGPFVDGRIIDLSRRAAQLLGYETAGTAQVRVKILRDESIQVANEVLHGQPTRVLVAQTQRVTRIAAAAPPVVSVAPGASSAPASLRAPVVVAGTPRPDPAPPALAPEPPPARMRVLQPEPEPQPAPRVARQDVQVAAVPASRRWPSLISQAHADTLKPSLALPPAPAQKPVLASTRGGSRIFVQAGAFAVPENAQRARHRIAPLGSVEVVPATAHGSALYRVRVGPVSSEAEAARLRSRLVENGYPGARVIEE